MILSRYSPSVSDSEFSLNMEPDGDEDEGGGAMSRPSGCWSSPPNFFDDSFRGASPTNRESFVESRDPNNAGSKKYASEVLLRSSDGSCFI